MRPLTDIVQDQVFIIGRFRELLGPETKWIPVRPRERYGVVHLMGYEGPNAKIAIFSETSSLSPGRIIVVRNYCSQVPEDIVYEVLGQIESLDTIRRNKALIQKRGFQPFDRFLVYYQ